MGLITEFEPITAIVGNEKLKEELASYPQSRQKKLFQLMKEIMADEMAFVLAVERYSIQKEAYVQ